ncbi:hypothetical protein GJ496_000214 [Pomphorhynchus laevis]|nr:hypothetical protein GJ496_000214 [Pomphorhynchus laevis]
MEIMQIIAYKPAATAAFYHQTSNMSLDCKCKLEEGKLIDLSLATSLQVTSELPINTAKKVNSLKSHKHAKKSNDLQKHSLLYNRIIYLSSDALYRLLCIPEQFRTPYIPLKRSFSCVLNNKNIITSPNHCGDRLLMLTQSCSDSARCVNKIDTAQTDDCNDDDEGIFVGKNCLVNYRRVGTHWVTTISHDHSKNFTKAVESLNMIHLNEINLVLQKYLHDINRISSLTQSVFNDSKIVSINMRTQRSIEILKYKHMIELQSLVREFNSHLRNTNDTDYYL